MMSHVAHNELAITVVGILGNVISGLVYLAPLPTYYRIYKKKSTESFQSVPYVVALFSSMLWLYYALLKTKEYFLLSINSVGCITETLYIVFYVVYASQKARINTAKLVVSLNLVVFSMIFGIVQFIIDAHLLRVQVLGYICAIVTIGVFAAPLTIMMKVIRTRSVEFMPFYLSLFLTLCAIVWLVYGILREDLFVSIPNIFGFVLGVLQMVLYAIWKNCCSKELQSKPDNPISKVVENSVVLSHHQKDCKPEEQEQIADQPNGTNEV